MRFTILGLGMWRNDRPDQYPSKKNPHKGYHAIYGREDALVMTLDYREIGLKVFVRN